MKMRFLAAVVTLFALCALDAPKAQAYRGFGGVYRGGFYGRGFYGRGFYGGFYRPWYRPFYAGLYRPWFRPYYGFYGLGGYGGYSPYYYGGYSPYYYGNYSPYYYGNYGICSPIGSLTPTNATWDSAPTAVALTLPPGDATFAYNGGPQSLVPVPTRNVKSSLVAVQAKETSVRFPAYGELSPPVTAATAPVQTISYAAYGDQPSAPTVLVSNNKR